MPRKKKTGVFYPGLILLLFLKLSEPGYNKNSRFSRPQIAKRELSLESNETTGNRWASRAGWYNDSSRCRNRLRLNLNAGYCRVFNTDCLCNSRCWCSRYDVHNLARRSLCRVTIMVCSSHASLSLRGEDNQRSENCGGTEKVTHGLY